MISIKVINITVKQFRVVCLVELSGEKYSSPELKAKLLEKLPNLAYHKCKNSTGDKFIEVMDSTSVPHLFEHIVIDLQSKFTDEVLYGTTEWIDEAAGTAKIELSYKDDLVCLDAIKRAVEILN